MGTGERGRWMKKVRTRGESTFLRKSRHALTSFFCSIRALTGELAEGDTISRASFAFPRLGRQGV